MRQRVQMVGELHPDGMTFEGNGKSGDAFMALMFGRQRQAWHIEDLRVRAGVMLGMAGGMQVGWDGGVAGAVWCECVGGGSFLS